MKLLFITRTYPPLVGGMEKFASDFYSNYRKVGEIDLLANPGGKKTILFFLLKALFVLVLSSRKYDVIHLYDAVLFPLIPLIRLFSKAKISFTVNGLDIVYSRFGYQKVMPFFLRQADKIIGISQYTMMQCGLRGIPQEKLCAIPIGITFNESDTCSSSSKPDLLSKFNLPSGKKILITIGRLVKRKGHAWFVRNVVNVLPDRYIYLIAGNGPEQESIKQLVSELGLDSKVFVLGQVTEEEKICLYQISELFIMPNITEKNDQEGFGIVLLEAGRYGLPVIASNLEGIKDAVIDSETGRLVNEKDAQGFLDAILNPGIDRSSLPDKVASNFDWQHIIEKYRKVFTEISLGER